jgi:hypothetical protein
MTNKPTPKEPENVSCDVCLTEIPESVAMSGEGDEYTQHYCGIECYDKWREKKELLLEAKGNEGTNDKK